VISDAVPLNERDEISGGETRERGFAEVRISGDEIIGSGVEVGEVAAAAAGDRNLFADTFSVFEDYYFASTFAGFNGAKEPGGSSSNDGDVSFDHALSVSRLRDALFGLGGKFTQYPPKGGTPNEKLTAS